MQVTHGGEIRISLSKEELLRLADEIGDGTEIVIRIPMEDSMPLNEESRGWIYDRECGRKDVRIATMTMNQFLKEDK